MNTTWILRGRLPRVNEAVGSETSGSGPLSVLRHRNFRIYWTGQTISLVGLWMQQVAQAWVVAGLAQHQGNAQTIIATIGFVSSLPMIALALAGGVVADRYDRRKIMMLTQLGLAGCAFGYAVLVGGGHLTLGHVYGLALVLGTVIAFDLPAQQALVPELVPPADIPKAVSLNSAIFHGSRLVGPALAGLLIAATSTAMAFVANGVSYFAVIISLLIIRTPARTPSKPQTGRAALREGLRYIGDHADVRALIGFTALTTAFVFPMLVVFMAIAVKTLYSGDETALGVVMASSGLGAMLGALSLTRVPAGARGRVIVVSCVGAALSLAALSLVHEPWLAAALVCAMNVNVALGLGLSATILQVTVPNELRGRVMSVYGMTFTGLMPSVALALGALADQVGLRTTIQVMALAYVCFGLPWLLHAGLWRRLPRAVVLPSAE